MTTQFTAPTGRMLWGSPFTPSTLTEDDNKTPKRDKVTGEVLVEYSFGVAYAKNDPAWPAFYALLKAEDKAAWPQYHGPDGNKLPGVAFADKITDGDGHNTKGVDLKTRDGYAGHWVVKYASRFPPTCYAYANGAWVQMTDPKGIKPGYFVQVNGSTASNNATGTQKAGMYRNVNMVAFIAYGAEIQSGGDPNEAFGTAAPPALPPGASATPLAPSAPMPAAPGVAMPPQPPSVTPPAPVTSVAPPAALSAPPAAPTAPISPSSPVMTAAATATYAEYKGAGWADEQLIAQGLMVAPSTGFMAPPPAPAAPAPAPPKPQHVMLPAAQGATYEAMIANGWSDDQLVVHGMMAAG
jgi:hypothetical protein